MIKLTSFLPQILNEYILHALYCVSVFLKGNGTACEGDKLRIYVHILYNVKPSVKYHERNTVKASQHYYLSNFSHLEKVFPALPYQEWPILLAVALVL